MLLLLLRALLLLHEILNCGDFIHSASCINIIINRMNYASANRLCYIFIDLILGIIRHRFGYNMSKQYKNTSGYDKFPVKLAKLISTEYREFRVRP